MYFVSVSLILFQNSQMQNIMRIHAILPSYYHAIFPFYCHSHAKPKSFSIQPPGRAHAMLTEVECFMVSDRHTCLGFILHSGGMSSHSNSRLRPITAATHASWFFLVQAFRSQSICSVAILQERKVDIIIC